MAASQRMVGYAFDRWVQHLSDVGYSHVETLYYSHGEFVHDVPVEFDARDYRLYRDAPGWRLARLTDEAVPSYFSTNTGAHAWFLSAVGGV